MRFIQALLDAKKKIFFLILPAVAIFTGVMVCKTIMPINVEDVPEELEATSFEEEPPSQAETIMKALSSAYPEWIGTAEFRMLDEEQQMDEGGLPNEDGGDWAFTVRGKWFYYSGGRILPEELRNKATEYRATGFYRNYPAELPSWESTVEQRAVRTRNMEENRARQSEARPDAQPPRRTEASRQRFFYEALWNISNRDEALQQITEIKFLGYTVKVHSGIKSALNLVEETILNESKTNPTVRQWIDSLGTIAAWNWRNVASSGSLSFHSYGIAIDILPANLHGLATYWLWASQSNPQWWNIPYSERYHPPTEVIRAFESYGFIWGGKWPNYDTMHFEYHPEVFIFSDIPMVNFSRN